MTQDIDALFQKTKGQLFYQRGAGFLGRILGQIGFQWTTEIDTAAISVDTLYWNPDFFLKLTPSSRVTVLAHELWHNGSLHGPRMGNRCPDKWNEAGDHMINLHLLEHGYDMTGFPYLMDPRFKKMATEDIYDVIVKEGGKPMQRPMGSDIMPCDKGDVHNAVGKVVAAVTAAKISGAPGDMPGEITLVLDQFLNPKLPWYTLLFNFFNEMTTDEYSYSRPNRRYYDPIMPGKSGRNGLEHLIYYLDISGSITDDHILRFNSEVKYIKEELEPELLTLVTFDTKICDEYTFERDDPFEKIVVTGRGGTSLTKVFKHAKKHQPTAMIVFSDLEVDIPKDPGIPIIWVCIDNKTATVPFGRLIHIKD